MKKNITGADRVVRILIFVAAIALYFTHVIAGTTAIILLAIGTILLLTSLINFCPIYYALGINKPKKENKAI